MVLAESSVAGCTTAIAESTPDSQLIDNGDLTVTDRFTGLMWKQCAEGQTNDVNCSGTAVNYNWQSSLEIPETLNAGVGFAGYTDWRLPNIKELNSIIDEACGFPAMNTTRFPNASSNQFWSSSPDAGDEGRAWRVNFVDGRVSSTGRLSKYNVRLVRNAP
jgi:hypothetical protein